MRLGQNKKNLVIVSEYAPGSEWSEEEREHFWQELNECLMLFAPGDSDGDGRHECKRW